MWREKSPISEKDSLRIRKWLLENQSGYLGIKKFKKKNYQKFLIFLYFVYSRITEINDRDEHTLQIETVLLKV